MKKRRIAPLLVGLLCLFVGAGAAGYPLIRNFVLEYQARQEIADYEAAMGQADSESFAQMRAQAGVYNAALLNENSGRANSEGKQEAVSVADYGDMLALTDSIGYLEIPKLGVYLPIYHGLEEEVLQKGIGHIPETSLPVGGASTHCVLSGHSGLPAARLLTELDQMEEGDLFYLHVMDETLAYCVDQISVVLPDDTSQIQIEEGKDYVTLLTCTPYGVNSHRLLVRGERTEYTPAAVSLGEESQGRNPLVSWRLATWGAALGIALLLVLLGIMAAVRGRRRNRDER